MLTQFTLKEFGCQDPDLRTLLTSRTKFSSGFSKPSGPVACGENEDSSRARGELRSRGRRDRSPSGNLDLRAVNRQGARVGKGGGYSDLEFALLTGEKKIDRKTPIVTSVDPLQIINEEIPMTKHDIPLSAIVTPNENIEIASTLARPKGIYWKILPPEKIEAIPVLKNRKKRKYDC
jgi:hypothetical protein